MLDLEGSVSGWLRHSHLYRTVLARTLGGGRKKERVIDHRGHLMARRC